MSTDTVTDYRPRRILATDCGSTTTKAILIEYDPTQERFALKFRDEAPTTVERPFNNVCYGFRNAVRGIEKLSGYGLLEGDVVQKPMRDGRGVDVYVSTSSAGGGLQMMIAGLVNGMSVESGKRAALGAGAIVSQVLSVNDGIPNYKKIAMIRNMRPDIFLICGGTDGGNDKFVLELAELIQAAKPRARFGDEYSLPIVYAGNSQVAAQVEAILLGYKVQVVENVRPTLEKENLGPARKAIHDIFMHHVMQQAPGYSELMEMTSAGIMPTPSAVGYLVDLIANRRRIQALGVDIGGATTDMFSVFRGEDEKPVFNRTVSANLGLSYSVSNVLAETGLDNILRWVPYDPRRIGVDVRNMIKNKMIRPTTIPQTLPELFVEQAIAREALRLAFQHHQTMAVGLKGVQQKRTISDAFIQTETGRTLVDMLGLNMIIGSGGPLSHAPYRMQAALMMLDAFQPQGVTDLYVDSIFMMPHLGVLAQINPEAAMDVFWNDCLIPLCPTIVPLGHGKEGKPCLRLRVGGREEVVNYGEIKAFTLPDGTKERFRISLEKGFEFERKQRDLETELTGGRMGVVIVDARGRPLVLPEGDERLEKLNMWYRGLGLSIN